MSVALYMDEHVHRAITAGLRLRGVDVLTAQEDSRRNVLDDVLLDRATELQRVLFSQDEDPLAKATPSSERRNSIRWRRLCSSTACHHWCLCA